MSRPPGASGSLDGGSGAFGKIVVLFGPVAEMSQIGLVWTRFPGRLRKAQPTAAVGPDVKVTVRAVTESTRTVKFDTH
jgi:hypothetical protein